MANTRVYYATQAVGLTPRDPGNQAGAFKQYPKGLQSVGVTTNFNLEQVFQLGQLEIYDNVENVPDVEVSLQKISDGSKFLYPICVEGTGVTDDVAGKVFREDIGAVSTNRVEVELSIYKDTSTDAFDSQDAVDAYGTVTCSGMYLSSVAYTIPVEGFITEDVTLVGNSKVYSNAADKGAGVGGVDGGAGDGGKTLSPSKIGRRINLSDESTLPTGTLAGNQSDGITKGSIAINPRTDGKGNRPYLQNINVSMDLGREAVFELGKFAPYARYATFPIEVSSEFEVLAESHDQVQARDFDDVGACATTEIKNLDDREIKIILCGKDPTKDKYVIDLGLKNKLTSVNFSGGDTGGGNATITYSYQTFNKFTVDASGTFVTATGLLIGGAAG